jgi:Flp pilus assembly protein TadG
MSRQGRDTSAWQRLIRDKRGAAAVEMALCLPIFGYMGLNLMDYGIYTFAQTQTEIAAEMAVGAARNLCNSSALLPATGASAKCGANLTSQMTAAAQGTSLGTSVKISSPAEGYYCANTGGTLVSVAAINAAPPATCAQVVAGSTSAPGDYINVTASYTYVPFAPGMTIASLLPGTIQQTSWMRLL